MTRILIGMIWVVSRLALAEGALERGEYGPLDRASGTALYDWPVEVAPGVFSAIGATQPGTYENAGHNNNLSFIIDNTMSISNFMFINLFMEASKTKPNIFFTC